MSLSPPNHGIDDLDHQACTNRRFLVQLRLDADPARGVYRGRVQHLRSGEAAHFDSLEELAAFITAMAASGPGGNLGGAAGGNRAP